MAQDDVAVMKLRRLVMVTHGPVASHEPSGHLSSDSMTRARATTDLAGNVPNQQQSAAPLGPAWIRWTGHATHATQLAPAGGP